MLHFYFIDFILIPNNPLNCLVLSPKLKRMQTQTIVDKNLQISDLMRIYMLYKRLDIENKSEASRVNNTIKFIHLSFNIVLYCLYI